ncbi:MAG: carbon-nitrogen hydrolase family protein [Ruminococcaceae bacterium]|nr:carbon-nitrogen hydrolase family protein [Oscillospiraceae bacterium]
MRIALAAMPVIDRDIPHNVEVICRTAMTFAGKADLILFGESVLQGFEAFTWDYSIDRQLAVSVDSPMLDPIRSAAKDGDLAISFGYLEQSGDLLYSSQLVIDETGATRHNFHRVSMGWKEPTADHHYVEGECFSPFTYRGKTFAIGLCGDLWTPCRPEEMLALHPDIVLWPVYCDYPAEEWNTRIVQEYAEQAKLCGRNVLLVNPVCLTPNPEGLDRASGGAVWFQDGQIRQKLPAGGEGVLLVEV